MSASVGDPFGEGEAAHLRARVSVLGGDFLVTTSTPSLLRLALETFGGLPRHRLEHRPPRFSVRLVLTDRQPTWTRGDAPPPPVLSSGAGLLCATIDAGNYAVVDVDMSRAMVCVSKAMLEQAYYPRYELIELAFLTLSSRGQALVPLHAACVGTSGNGVLLIGASGSGKSTLCLHALAGGMQLLSEDSAFVAARSLRVTGVSNYLHLTQDALAFLRPGAFRRAIERSPVIQRRSGVRKLEVDVRSLHARIPRKPLRLVATVFLSRRTARSAQALQALDRDACVARLRSEQRYAVRRFPGWAGFERRVAALPSYKLRRTEHPDIAVRQLRDLLRAAE
ncbi:MAG TPA: serine kinase [Gammaproteobacteria bacterium]|nr:serine kinase [Gammaproteobacteria bacterium]